MFVRKIKPFSITLEVDADKSITHRAFILGAAAEGVTKIYNPSLCADCLSTINCLRNSGVSVSKDGDIIRVCGGGTKKGEFLLDAGNSGTTVRLLAGFFVSKLGTTVCLSGDQSLSKRPMRRITEPLIKMGAQIEYLGNSFSSENSINTTEMKCKADENSLPIKITGRKLCGIEYRLPIPSAQLKSALLIAGLDTYGITTLSGEIFSRNHTEIMLSAMGANIKTSGDRIILQPSKIKGIDINGLGDFSSAIYFLILGLFCKDSTVTVRNVNTNPTRTAALKLLKNCGAQIFLSNERNDIEKSADITAIYSNIHPFKITADIAHEMIDELPLLAVAACFIEGESIIEGAAELRVKESDRISAIAAGLRKMGAAIEVLSDGLKIVGNGMLKGGCKVSSFGDHRIEMSLVVAASLSDCGAEIEEGYAAISFPNFYSLFERINA